MSTAVAGCHPSRAWFTVCLLHRPFRSLLFRPCVDALIDPSRCRSRPKRGGQTYSRVDWLTAASKAKKLHFLGGSLQRVVTASSAGGASGVELAVGRKRRWSPRTPLDEQHIPRQRMLGASGSCTIWMPNSECHIGSKVLMPLSRLRTRWQRTAAMMTSSNFLHQVCGTVTSLLRIHRSRDPHQELRRLPFFRCQVPIT